MLARRNGWALICVAALLSGAVVVTNANPATAGAPTAGDAKEQAKAAYQEGNKKFEAGDYAAALPHFQKADELYPGSAPKHKIAVCFDKLGKHKEAIAAYKAFLDSDPSEKMAEDVASSKARLAELEATLPGTLTIKVNPPDAKGVKISADGEPKEGTTLELGPGQHKIVVTAKGFQPLTEEVIVKGAEERELVLTLAPAAKAAAPPPPPTTPPSEEEEEEGGSSDVPAYVTLGIAGAGVILGTIFGIQAIGAKSDFDDDPTNENADDAERAALIADMSFGVALTFGVTGIVLLFTGDDDADEAEEGAEARWRPDLLPYAGTKGGGMAATWTF